MSWFYLIFYLSFIIGNLEASHHHEKKHPSAVVVGTVYCDTCFQAGFSKSSHFISGASVAVECKDEASKPSFRQEVKTDEHGEFMVHLPFSVSKHVRRIKKCSVQLINSSEPYCAVASTATSSSLHLKAKKPGIHIFSAGFFTFKPLKQPNVCNQKPSLENSKELNSEKTSPSPFEDHSRFPPPIQDPTTPVFSPLPGLPTLPPLPQLPPLPSLPGLPYLPPMPGNAQETEPEKHPLETYPSDEKVDQPDFLTPLPPNPLLPPPTLPPNPLQPPPFSPPKPLLPPPLFPPNPLLPPPSPLIPLPPIPGLTPPPPPPTFPFIPLPPFPPRIPGIPPASSSSSFTEKPSP